MRILKEGDRVRHIYKGYAGTVDTIYSDGYIYVRFDNPDVLPCKLPTTEYEYIEEACDKINDNDVCPKCGSDWTETFISYEPKYDCIKCNIRKEDCVNEVRSSV